jgi:hypothetical protein
MSMSPLQRPCLPIVSTHSTPVTPAQLNQSFRLNDTVLLCASLY